MRKLSSNDGANLTTDRIRVLRYLTMNGRTVSWDTAWNELTTRGYTKSITKESLRGRLSVIGFGIKKGMVYEKALGLTGKAKKQPRKKVKLYKLSALEKIHNEVSSFINYSKETIAP